MVTSFTCTTSHRPSGQLGSRVGKRFPDSCATYLMRRHVRKSLSPPTADHRPQTTDRRPGRCAVGTARTCPTAHRPNGLGGWRVGEGALAQDDLAGDGDDARLGTVGRAGGGGGFGGARG